jgi:hypothetical protein
MIQEDYKYRRTTIQHTYNNMKEDFTSTQMLFLQTVTYELAIVDSRFSIADCRLPTADCRLNS